MKKHLNINNLITLAFVECGRMEMVKDDSTWGCCAVWVEEAT